jgi:hypothetical protein
VFNVGIHILEFESSDTPNKKEISFKNKFRKFVYDKIIDSFDEIKLNYQIKLADIDKIIDKHTPEKYMEK